MDAQEPAAVAAASYSNPSFVCPAPAGAVCSAPVLSAEGHQPAIKPLVLSASLNCLNQVDCPAHKG